MKERKKSMVVLGIIAGFMAGAMVLPRLIGAGDLNPPAGPGSSTSAMYTLEDIYNRLNDNTTATTRSGGFKEPASGPGSTGHTLDEVYEKAIPTQVHKTGQTELYYTGDDGDVEKGVAWPNPRFTDNGDGTVTDNMTELIWLKDASCLGGMRWTWAVDVCSTILKDGFCGLTDGSEEGDWRLPNIEELQSLIHYGFYLPAVPNTAGTGKWKEGDPFNNLMSRRYWSSSTPPGEETSAWSVDTLYGTVRPYLKSDAWDTLAVRGGK
ncbi:MAG: DUF1566 domain-containing protein [Deltaproteobacteria bacterium]|nr:DUF1566 domain-containing protein [Deltaproteobacteria bacterium]